MDSTKQTEYWLKSAKHDLKAATGLFRIKRYDWCLYVGHLVIEKTLKALWAKERNDFPPKTHNLLYLAEKIGFSLNPEQQQLLSAINDFCLEARYPDAKFSFYKTCTPQFTSHYFNAIKELYKWLLSKMK